MMIVITMLINFNWQFRLKTNELNIINNHSGPRNRNIPFN